MLRSHLKENMVFPIVSGSGSRAVITPCWVTVNACFAHIGALAIVALSAASRLFATFWHRVSTLVGQPRAGQLIVPKLTSVEVVCTTPRPSPTLVLSQETQAFNCAHAFVLSSPQVQLSWELYVHGPLQAFTD